MKTAFFRTVPVFLLAFGAFCAPAFAQTESAGEAAAMDPETLQRGIDNINTQIEHRQERITELTNDIITLDGRIEGRVTKIVDMLKNITDSQESQIRVAKTKEQIIEGLRNSIQYYDTKRRELKSETMKKQPRLTRDELFDDIGVFDGKIETRVNQIVELANSLHTHEDVDKWTVAYEDDDRGWRDDYYRRRNPKFYHDRKQTTNTEQTRGQLTEELRNSINRIDVRNRDINETLKKDITPQYRQMLEAELDRNMATIENREAQILDLATSTKPAAEAIGRNQILRIEDIIEDMGEDLRNDFNDLFADYAELNQERAALKTLNEMLEKYQGTAK